MKKLKNWIKSHKKIYKILFELKRKIYIVYLYVVDDILLNSSFHFHVFLRKMNLEKADRVLSKLKGKHKNQRIFVVSTGPSLRLEDLEWLHKNKEITISMNSVFQIFDKTEWRPTYYINGDFKAFDKKYEGRKIEDMSLENTLISRQIARKLHYKFDKTKVGVYDANWLDHRVNWHTKRYKYKTDIKTYGCYCFQTITNSAINLADFMGCTEIYLLGCDCDLTQNKEHVGETKKNEMPYNIAKAKMRRMTEAYVVIKRILNSKGVQVYNATRGGKLEVFPRIDLDDLIGKDKK